MKRTILSTILASIAVCSCTRTVYVPVESEKVRTEVRTDTVYEVRDRTENLIDRDTVSTYVMGDTVRVEVTRWRIRERLRTDTVIRYKTVAARDSVARAVPIEVEKRVEVSAPLKWWQRTLMAAGVACLLFLLANIIALWLTRKKK